MTQVYMYTIYNDLLNNKNPEEVLEKQRPRDAILRRAMVAHGIPDFPLRPNEVDQWIPFLQQKIRDIPQLNIVLIHKNGNIPELYRVIRGDAVDVYSTEKATFDSITRTSVGKYTLYSYKIDP